MTEYSRSCREKISHQQYWYCEKW